MDLWPVKRRLREKRRFGANPKLLTGARQKKKKKIMFIDDNILINVFCKRQTADLPYEEGRGTRWLFYVIFILANRLIQNGTVE